MMSSDEALANSLAIEEYSSIINNQCSNSDHMITHNKQQINSNKKPSILDINCLPSRLRSYVTNESIIDINEDIAHINPDIFQLFTKYNYMFFDNKLGGIEVKWSKRMTACAGICSYEGSGGLCSIRLSEPVLKYRSSKDMIETLVHEMIHAYLFVIHKTRDRSGHGIRFQSLMNVINYCSSLDISIYHQFYDEVEVYRTHVWKCNGKCVQKPPFFGIVKRSMNRPPTVNDKWWVKHQRECGGVFRKISEPKEFTEKQKLKEIRKQKKKKKENQTLDEFFKKGNERKRKYFDVENVEKYNGSMNILSSNSNENKIKRRRINDSSVSKLPNNSYLKKNGESEIDEELVVCPICEQTYSVSTINLHLDQCLSL